MIREVFAAFLALTLGATATAPRIEAPRAEGTKATTDGDVAKAAPEEARAEAPPPIGFREMEGKAPPGLKVDVARSNGALVVHAKMADEIVVLRRGADRASGAVEATLTLADVKAEAPIVVETSSFASFDTARSIVRIEGAGGSAPRVSIKPAEAPAAFSVHEESKKHACKSQHDGFGGFTVLCKVFGSAGAANLTDENPDAGVVSYAGFNEKSGEPTTLLRFDFDAKPGTVDARVFGYNAGGVGVLGRVEMSYFPGEKRPTLVILSAQRSQPFPFVRGWRFRHPIEVDF